MNILTKAIQVCNEKDCELLYLTKFGSHLYDIAAKQVTDYYYKRLDNE